MTTKTVKTTTLKSFEFQIRYSYVLEDLNMRFFGNIDRFITFIQIAAGTSALASFGDMRLFGLIITALSIFSFILQPAIKSDRSMQQRQRYVDLLPNLHANDLGERFEAVQKSDSICFSAFNNVAYIRAALMCRRDVFNKKLTIIELIAARLGGDFVKRKGNK